ncbi:HTH-type transcriptional repressor CytR [Clostridium sp. N3C]|nr:HTH-type transcriptional repressor CytR [Clostridium sp. N3C]
MKKLLQLDPFPDAVICINDYTAFGAIRALKETNLKLPEEVGIITFDNFPLAPYMTPSLTSIDIDTFMLGKRAGEIIMERIKGNKIHKQESISPGIILRDSTAREKIKG